MISVSALISFSPSITTWNGRDERSARVTLPVRMSAPNRSACLRISPIRSGPLTLSGCPGKFSTSVVVVSCPPGSMPS
jgi:hypothetical protein